MFSRFRSLLSSSKLLCLVGECLSLDFKNKRNPTSCNLSVLRLSNFIFAFLSFLLLLSVKRRRQFILYCSNRAVTGIRHDWFHINKKLRSNLDLEIVYEFCMEIGPCAIGYGCPALVEIRTVQGVVT